jgi:hypothetical protein
MWVAGMPQRARMDFFFTGHGHKRVSEQILRRRLDTVCCRAASRAAAMVANRRSYLAEDYVAAMIKNGWQWSTWPVEVFGVRQLSFAQ